MDPYGGMLADKDTSFDFMRTASQRGHTILHCLPKEVTCLGSRVSARVEALELSEQGDRFEAAKRAHVELSAIDAIFIRKDPPFDAAYLYLTQQLDLVKNRTLVLNDPRAVRDANEKLFALQFERFMPATLVSSNEQALIEFVSAVGGRAVIKPLDGAGGSGVAMLSADDVNLRPLIGLLTAEGSRLAMVQEFQPTVTQGDKRVLLLDGKLLGVIRRVPPQGDIRANIHVGGQVVGTELTEQEQQLVDDIGPSLSEAGLFFVGLDLIGGKLIEVNVTSPTGIQELGRLTGTDPSGTVIDWVEERAKAINQAG